MHVAFDSQAIEIARTKVEECIVMISKSERNFLQEMIYIQSTGGLNRMTFLKVKKVKI